MEELRKVNQQMYECYSWTAANIITYCNAEDREEMLNSLRGNIEKLCNFEERITAVQKITQVLESHDPETENAEDAQKAAKDYDDKIANIVTDASNNPNLNEFDRTVNLLKAEANVGDTEDADGGDKDLELTQNNVNVIDPITKQRMIDPMSSARLQKRGIFVNGEYDNGPTHKDLFGEVPGLKFPRRTNVAENLRKFDLYIR